MTGRRAGASGRPVLIVDCAILVLALPDPEVGTGSEGRGCGEPVGLDHRDPARLVAAFDKFAGLAADRQDEFHDGTPSQWKTQRFTRSRATAVAASLRADLGLRFICDVVLASSAKRENCACYLIADQPMSTERP